MKANKAGYLADENMDAIAMATQNNLAGKGIVFADGTGFGKARQAIGVVNDWIFSGHVKRLLLTTNNTQNIENLIDTFQKSGMKVPKIVRLTDYKVGGENDQSANIPVIDGAVYLIPSHRMAT